MSRLFHAILLHMKSLIRAIIITILSILLLSWLLPAVTVANTVTLILAGVVLALLNTCVKPILKLLVLPINILTLGLLGWLINLLMIYLAMWLVPGFSISEISLLGMQFNEFWSVVLVSVLMSVFGSFFQGLL